MEFRQLQIWRTLLLPDKLKGATAEFTLMTNPDLLPSAGLPISRPGEIGGESVRQRFLRQAGIAGSQCPNSATSCG